MIILKFILVIVLCYSCYNAGYHVGVVRERRETNKMIDDLLEEINKINRK